MSSLFHGEPSHFKYISSIVYIDVYRVRAENRIAKNNKILLLACLPLLQINDFSFVNSTNKWIRQLVSVRESTKFKSHWYIRHDSAAAPIYIECRCRTWLSDSLAILSLLLLLFLQPFSNYVCFISRVSTQFHLDEIIKCTRKKWFYIEGQMCALFSSIFKWWHSQHGSKQKKTKRKLDKIQFERAFAQL